MSGQIHIYTGNGKGKTTAALGLLLRSYGAGNKILFVQFIKDMEYSEITPIKDILKDKVTYKRFGKGCFIDRRPTEEDKIEIQNGFEEVKSLIASNNFNLVILDELNIANYFNLITTEQMLELCNTKNNETELVITGRYAPQELIDRADLVTEMKEIKHYYQNGLLARVGIEK